MLFVSSTGRLYSGTPAVTFTLSTETNETPPQFTITCHTHEGPATTVLWILDDSFVDEDSNHKTSQTIVDTSHDSIYENNLHVTGRRGGTYTCIVDSNIRNYLTTVQPRVVDESIEVTGRLYIELLL